jgi:hypothetical protein
MVDMKVCESTRLCENRARFLITLANGDEIIICGQHLSGTLAHLITDRQSATVKLV